MKLAVLKLPNNFFKKQNLEIFFDAFLLYACAVATDADAKDIKVNSGGGVRILR